MKMSRAWFSLRASVMMVALWMLVAPSTAAAQDIHAEPPPMRATASPVFGLLELRFGSYKPNIDREFSAGGPYETMFGNGSLLFETALHWHVYQGIGKVSVAGSLGIFNKKGHAFTEDGEKSADRTALMIIPTRLSLVYRFDYLQERWRVPFVLSAKLGLDYYFWNTKSAGYISDGVAGGETIAGRGGTFGWHYGFTLYFWLNWLAPGMAASFDGNTGINNSYLFAEFMGTRVDNFGGKNSWDLGDNVFMFGLAFEF